MKISLFLLLILLWTHPSIGQLYSAKESNITFFSSAPIEDIRVSNTAVQSIFNTKTNEIVFSLAIENFEFEKDLMKEHFNEKYMESDLYPKSTFKGVVSGFDINQSGAQTTAAKGVLSIHGISNEVTINGKIENINGNLVLNSVFFVKLKDYQIEIPKLLINNISEEVEVTIKITYEKYGR